MLHYFGFTIQLFIVTYTTLLYRKSEEPCIWHIKNYYKCMIFYEELQNKTLNVCSNPCIERLPKFQTSLFT